MAVDPLDEVLRLVAEGRLTADEAAPILAALDEQHGKPGGSNSGGSGRASALRLEIRDHGRQVVNLRLPLAVGKLALDRIPGLSGDQVERVRAALATGAIGPLLVVEDEAEGESVRIIIE
jgi:hypothetical protein